MTADIYTTERPYYHKGKHVLNGEKSETLLFNMSYKRGLSFGFCPAQVTDSVPEKRISLTDVEEGP